MSREKCESYLVIVLEDPLESLDVALLHVVEELLVVHVDFELGRVVALAPALLAEANVIVHLA